MGLTVSTIRSQPAVTLDHVKEHLRIDLSDDDSLLSAYIDAATEYVEDKCNITLSTTSYTLTCDAFPSDYIELTRGPVSSVTSVKYYTGDVLTTWASSNYRVDTSERNGRLYPKESVSWPSGLDTRTDAIEVIYVAGKGNTKQIDSRAKVAVMWLVGHWYENREAASDVSLSEAPLSVKTMLDQLTIYPAKAYR